MQERSIGPWKLSKAEARALDLICVFDDNADAAAFIGVSQKTLEIQLGRAYAQMRLMGANLTGHPRIRAMNLWQTYWRSEAGKANLRNVRLTAQHLA